MNFIIKDYLNPTASEFDTMKKIAYNWSNELKHIFLGTNEIVALAYAALVEKYKTEKKDELYDEVCLNFAFIKCEDGREVINKVKEECDTSILKCIIVNADTLTNSGRDVTESTTPASIVDLSLDVLDIQQGDNVLDLCSGFGKFLTKAYLDVPNATYRGVDINPNTLLSAKIATKVLNNDIDYSLNSAFNTVKDNRKYSKIFSNYPFGLRIKELGKGFFYLEELEKRIPSITKATSADWIFNSVAIDVLEEGGRAVCITTNGAMFNTIDSPIRKYFVESGYVKAVIALPTKLFEATAISTTMVVFEKNKNNEVLFVDATEICQKGRRFNYLSSGDIKKIIDCFNKDEEYCRKVSINEIAEQEYNLMPQRYLSAYISMITVKDGMEFGNIIKSLTRGASIKAADLDDLISYEETEYQYLMLGNIQEGMIQENLPYLKNIDDNLKKYCLKEGDLIMSKNGYPYKVAVVGKTNKQILANGNMFIIELDKEKANPYYIKTLFESEKGGALLKSITVGATIPNFGASQLKSLMIPLPSIYKQNKIANEFLKIDNEIAVLKLRIKKIQERKDNLFEELSEGDDVE